MIDFKLEAQKEFETLVQDRRDFHRHPELGFKEERTSRIVAQRLNELGMEVQTGVGQTGVVGLLDGDLPGPTVLLRFDMDALPITEDTGLEFSSENPGVMHACGHDGHMSMGLGLARIMARHRDKIAGTLKFVFQPAEEGLGGAFAMIADGVLENPKPDVALAMHLWNKVPYGQAWVTNGPAMSASSRFELKITGRGGHGASPHETVDPILASAHVITALQSIVSRNVDPQESVVISVGMIEGGTTYNVIPESVMIKGSVRSFSNEIHRKVYRRILETASSVAAGFGCTVALETVVIVAAVVNDDGVSEQVRQSAQKVLGPENVLDRKEMASEDMGYMLEEVPGCYFFIGSANHEAGQNFPHHHPRFDFDERAMMNGIAVMGTAIASYVLPDGSFQQPKSGFNGLVAHEPVAISH
ncbi:MAG: amidohydrolase [Chloroflexota bacterium]